MLNGTLAKARKKLCKSSLINLRGGSVHSGETDEANCSWLHPVWPPPKRPDQDSTFCVVSRAFTELIFCIHRDFDVRNNVYKPRRLVRQCCRDISAWKSRVMKPTVLRDPGRMKPTEYRDEANWFSNWTDEANCWWFRGCNRCSRYRLCSQWVHISYRYLYTHVLWSQPGLNLWVFKVGEYIDEYHKWVPCAIIGHDMETRPQSDMCSSDFARIMVCEVMKHISKTCLDYDKITSEVRMHLLWK